MIDFGINIPSLLGLFNILLAIAYFIIMIVQIIQGARKSTGNSVNSSINIAFQIIELLYCPFAIFIVGIILIFQGWRLAPILQFQQLLLESVVIFLIAKDIIKKS